jgi:hypothetical protein
VTWWARGARALAVVALAAGCAQSRPFADELDAKPWEARKALLPPYPRGETLVPFYVGPSVFSYFIDRASIRVGEDGVVRYTLLARSASGATNVSYEGIRCGTYERRVYAFGRADGTWSQASNTNWMPIDRLASDPQTALADYMFCSERGPVSSTEDALEALDRGNRRR